MLPVEPVAARAPVDVRADASRAATGSFPAELTIFFDELANFFGNELVLFFEV